MLTFLCDGVEYGEGGFDGVGSDAEGLTSRPCGGFQLERRKHEEHHDGDANPDFAREWQLKYVAHGRKRRLSEEYAGPGTIFGIRAIEGNQQEWTYCSL